MATTKFWRRVMLANEVFCACCIPPSVHLLIAFAVRETRAWIDFGLFQCGM